MQGLGSRNYQHCCDVKKRTIMELHLCGVELILGYHIEREQRLTILLCLINGISEVSLSTGHCGKALTI